ncbi:MAG: site-2 protease family protein [Oscillospiraceae bacterium]|nr:site-2 protease family protein [Oscillospiraceae bacterium]
MMKYIIAILIFGIIIFVHEFGHFIAAKLCGIRVLKFAVGMGPKLIGKQIGETEYSLRILPIGGFCAMEGEETDAVSKKELGDDASSDSERSIASKPVWQRFLVFFAGPFMNLVLGFIVAIAFTCTSNAVPTTQIKAFHTASDGLISAESFESGLREGDIIKELNDMWILTPADISYQLSSHENGTHSVVVERDGEEVKLENVKFYDENNGSKADFYIKGLEKNPINVLGYSFKNTVSTTRLIWVSLIDLVTGKYGFDDMSGPVGVVDAIGDAAASGETLKESAMSLMNLTIIISVNLGIMNLLPIPGLDGGRILFLIIEAIRRKPIKPEHEGIVNLIGLALVMLLIVAVTFNDILKLIR